MHAALVGDCERQNGASR